MKLGISPAHSDIDTRTMRDVVGRFASGITIVAALDDDGPLGFTCQSFVSLSLDPPLIAICPAKSSTSWPRMTSVGRFSVNVLAEDQEDVCRAFARSGVDKFSGVAWSTGPYGTPVLDHVVASIECGLEYVHDAGDHELVIGTILSLHATERPPLLFFRGAFGRLDLPIAPTEVARGGRSVPPPMKGP